ncbi:MULTISPECIES: hypothetical protein [unclassified Streptosporangium]|uniref:hypothetical protein n=1 Tax=unclassified Streptosporangium TaxID=2632669 RepID=UPI002E2935B5|nr:MULTISPECIES: hypothetical protein [unclassified Streptosporangium]
MDDVVQLLPRRKRRDVASELRALLVDALAAKAADAGRAADEAMTRELLVGFGRPAEVAARYGPVFTIIDPADSRRFLWLTAAGMSFFWLFTSTPVLMRFPVSSAAEAGALLTGWLRLFGLSFLWWPGLLVVCFAVMAWLRRRQSGAATWTPRRKNGDQISRAGYIFVIIVDVCLLSMLINAGALVDSLFGERMAVRIHRLLAVDENFLSHHGPLLLGILVAHLALYVVLVVQGRWRSLTLRVDIGLTFAMCCVLTWLVLAGAIFQAEPLNRWAELLAVFFVLFALVDVGLKVRRELRRAAPSP